MSLSSCSSKAAVTTGSVLVVGSVLAAVYFYQRLTNKTQVKEDDSNKLKPAPRRFGGAIKLKRDKYVRYRELHDNVWDEVLDRMYKSNIRNFTIYYHEETSTLFQSFEWVGHWQKYDNNNNHDQDSLSEAEEKSLFEADMKAIAQDPVTRRWWKECEPCQEPFSQWDPDVKLLSDGGSAGNWWAPLECVCHCGHWPVAYS